MTKLEWVAVYAGVNLLILLILAMLVVRARVTHKVMLGDGGSPQVLQAMRAHANGIEYVPTALLGLFLLAVLEPVPILAVQGLGGALTVGRIAHAIGLSGSGGRSVGRMVGTLLTWATCLGTAGLLIWAGLAPLL